eukprot:TRINITY_DN10135_c0_g1_i1.p1 TRINITY_DN10135_c0_g1~~TRINITY_DN10135_c0_g1_i1.p1  ORF type:complete len:293 (-),score=70.72 TRINITY_DN10135_c0_g1_i1:141-1019(-)
MAITVDVNSPPVDINAPLDERDIDLVQQTFGRVAMLGADNVGKIVFMKIFKKAPQALQLFSFKADGLHPVHLFRSGGPAVGHATKVVGTVATAVSLLRDLDTLVPVLQELGLKHHGFGVLRAHYDVVGEALIESLQVGLGANFTEPVKNAWLKVFTIVKTTMLANVPEEPVAKVEPVKPPGPQALTVESARALLTKALETFKQPANKTQLVAIVKEFEGVDPQQASMGKMMKLLPAVQAMMGSTLQEYGFGPNDTMKVVMQVQGFGPQDPTIATDSAKLMKAVQGDFGDLLD